MSRQVSQDIKTGRTFVGNVPSQSADGGEVVVLVRSSVISAGTERYVVDLGRKSMLEKARARPDHVRRVLQKVRQEGLRSTLAQVQAKLAEPMPLGYSAAGTVLDAGAHRRRFAPGDRVAVVAPHVSIAAVSGNLCALIPDGVSFDQAAYTSIATIALQGVRNAKVTLGERVLVIGTGLIGLLTISLLRTQGCRVFATDISSASFELAAEFGADATATGSPAEAVRAFSRGLGVDAVIITAATDSNEPIEFAAAMCRPKGRIVLVGVAGLNIPRPPFFEKELEFTVSSSMGPGRNDPAYEGKNVDYPIGYARWTLQRNMEAVLDQMAGGRLAVERLTTHRFSIDDAPNAYGLLLNRSEPYLGIVLNYPEHEIPERTVSVSASPTPTGTVRVSLLGAGNFARLTLLPILSRQTGVSFRYVASAKGLTAKHVAERYGFAFATSDNAEVYGDPQTDVVMALTRHNLHASQVIAALNAGKHVFVEKPLCLTLDELDAIRGAVAGHSDRLMTVGFNRRYSPAVAAIRRHFSEIQPLSVSYRFAVPEIPESVWVQDASIGGGRIIGEACHAIDACIAITGSLVTRVFAEAVGSRGAVRTADDRVFITLRHANGSISNIAYQAGGDSSAPKERIEVFGGGRTASVEDFGDVSLWGDQRRSKVSGKGDKGHAAEFAAFLEACRSGGAWPISWTELESCTWASIAVVESLSTALPVERDVT